MQPIRQTGRSAGFAPAAVLDDGLRAHMLRIYNYMGLGLLVTGLVAVAWPRSRRSTCRSSARPCGGW